VPISATQTLDNTGSIGIDVFLNGGYSIRIETPSGSLWRESPVITGIVSSFLVSGFTAISMIADSTLVVGQFVQTVGYNTEGDGGDNTYKIVPALTGTADAGSFIDLTGSGFQAQGLFPQNQYNVKQWGATGDGVTVEGAAVKACFDFVASGQIEIPQGAYVCSDIDVVNLQNGVSINAYRGTLDFSGSTLFQSRVRLTGTADTSIALSVNALAEGTTITLVSAAGLAIKDLLILSSDALVELNTIGGTTTETIGEWVRIRSIAGNVLTLYGRLEGSYTTVDNGKIEKINTHKDSAIRGLGLIGKGGLQTGVSSFELGISCAFCENVVIEDCDIFDIDYQQVSIDQTYGFTVYNNSMLFTYRGSEAFTDVIQYGIAIKNVSSNGHVYHNTIEEGRHGIVFTENTNPGIGRDVIIESNIISRTYAAAISTHETNQRFSCIGNHITDCVRGFDVRVQQFNIENNTIIDSTGEAIFISEAISRGQILNNDISGGVFGIRMSNAGLETLSNPEDIMIMGNRMVNFSNKGIELAQVKNNLSHAGWKISNNSIKNAAGDFINVEGNFLMMEISDNKLEDDAGTSVGFGINILGTTNIVVKGNVIRGITPVRTDNDTQGAPQTPSNPIFKDNIWDHTSAFISQVTGTNVVLQDNIEIGAIDVTMAANVIVIPAGVKSVSVDTSGGAAEDLNTINGGHNGDRITFRSVSGARVPTFKDGVGNLRLAVDFALDSTDDSITLYRVGSNWHEVARSNNA